MPLAHAVDPAPAQDHVDRFLRRDRFEARADLVDLDPDLGFAGVMRTEPGVEALGVLEFVDLVRVDDHRCHGATCS
ncbi:hypothetical protein D3C87_1786460 [compost metagenome]